MSDPKNLEGKGIWARPRAGSTSELERAIAIAPQAGATHILYKAANGAIYFEGSAQAAQRISEAGLVPLAWMWLTLRDPAGEARVAARVFQDGFQGLVFNVEDTCSGKSTEARTLITAIRGAGLDPDRLYNCSFPNIFSHWDLPYEELNEICQGGLMPMSYGSFFAPGNPTPWTRQAQTVIDDWTYGHYERWCDQLQGDCPPLYPVLGPYHDEYGAARMGAEEFRIWLDRLAAHEPTFFSIFTAAVIDDALLPLIRRFVLGKEVVKRQVPGTAWVQPLEGTVLYETPGPTPPRLRAVVFGTALEGLARHTEDDGHRWLQVRTPGGSLGWVPEDRLALKDPGPPPKLPAPLPAPPGHLTHVWTEQEVNFRSQPVVQQNTLSGRLYPHARMRILEDPVKARTKLGKTGQWFNVQLEPDGPEGWIAAWYVTDHAPVHEVPGVPVSFTHVRVHSSIGLNVRSAPTTSSAKLWHVPDGTILEVENPHDAAAKIGKHGEWIRVLTPSLHRGYVAAWYLRADVQADERKPVSDAALPRANCAWIFGIHAAGSDEPADFQRLFHGTGKTGWVMFTEAIGANPAALHLNPQRRQRLWGWAQNGYGVIVRLNHAYEPSGTLPKSAHYQAFADTCARYADLYLKHHGQPDAHTYSWVVVVGNEQNNPREWPGRSQGSPEPITPARYALAFNLAYRAVKSVLPNAVVVSGAVDPYNAELQRPLDYFTQMLERIEALDGLALHTYTHGPHVELITKLTKFTDDPIKDHYYDFQAYRPFTEAIPPRWRNRPVYITESNHWTREDGSKGWVNRDIGWIRAAYREIHRWNSAPHAQQIHCLMIYRWLGDRWAIKSLGQVQADFRAALANDFRWRR